MRTVTTLLTVFFATAVIAPMVIVARLLRFPDGPHSFYQWAMHTWARLLCASAGVKLRVHGAEHIQRDRGTIYAANHVSWFDIFAIAAVLPSYSFVAKSELRRIPVFGWGAESAGIVFLDRDNRKAAFESYKIAAREVERGRSIVVCPEGTRGRDYHLRPFKKGPFVLAIAAQAPIVPTLVYGARDVMAKGSLRVRSGTIDVHFLDPVPTEGYDYEHRHELMEVVWHRLAELMHAEYGVDTHERAVAREKERLA